MLKFPRVVARHALDIITVALFVVAVGLLLQPTSWPRVAWSRYRAEAKSAEAVRRHWPDVARISARLLPGDSAIDVVVISDYECPFCRVVSPSIDSATRAGLRVAYLHLPLPIHQAAEGAALSALCAERSGRFPELHARLISNEQWRTDTNWVREARLAGVEDTTSFLACVASPATKEELRQHIAVTQSLLIRATPTFVHPRGVRTGVISSADLLSLGSRK
jgi:protein-disulfide isomerase